MADAPFIVVPNKGRPFQMTPVTLRNGVLSILWNEVELVFFGANEATNLVVIENGDALECSAMPHMPGPVDVRIHFKGEGEPYVARNAFTYGPIAPDVDPES